MGSSDYIENLLSVGRCTFTTEEVVEDLGKSREAARAAIRRLRQKGKVATPVRGFHVVVPPQYRRLECLPPREFVPFLMEYLDREYYAGLLTAAFFHGAAHQQPQVFQTMVDELRRDVECGRARVEFHKRRSLAEIPTEGVNTDYGELEISTPEATAIDLVGYSTQIGGLDRCATVFVELGEDLDGDLLRDIGPRIAPDAWLQRLGYLLDEIGHEGVTGPLADYVDSEVEEVTALVPGEDGRTGHPRSRKWRVAVNDQIEPDI